MPNRRTQHRLAQLALLAAAIIWGGAFVAQRTATEHAGAFLFNGTRFLLGAAVVGLYMWYFERRSLLARGAVYFGISIGTVLFFSASVQQIGVAHTSAGKAGFITGLYILFVPIILLVWKGKQTRRIEWFGIGAALAGLFLLSVTEGLQIAAGDYWVFLCAVGFAWHLVLIGEYVRGVDPFALAFWQFVTTGVGSLAVSCMFESPSIDALIEIGPEILYAGVLSVGVGYTIQMVAQQFTSAVTTGIILSFESVFAVLAGWLILDEVLSARQLAGCFLMLTGILLAQIPESARRVERPQ